MSIEETNVPKLRAAPESVYGATNGLNMFEASDNAELTANNMRLELAAFQVPPIVRREPRAAYGNAQDLVFEDGRLPIQLADIPVPGTGDERTMPLVPPTFGDNPYIDNQPVPYNPDVPTHSVHWGRPGETVPSNIEKPNEFTKSLLQAVQTAAARIHTVDDCARGVREGLNDMDIGFHINDDMKLDGQKYRWRSAVQFGDYLSKTGLFEAVPLDKISNKLEDGFIVVRHWNDGLVKQRGEDRGDIAVISHNGYQYNDHSQPFDPYESRYKDGYVLIPKGYVWQNQPIAFVQPKHPASRGGGGGHHAGGYGHHGGDGGHRHGHRR